MELMKMEPFKVKKLLKPTWMFKCKTQRRGTNVPILFF